MLDNRFVGVPILSLRVRRRLKPTGDAPSVDSTEGASLKHSHLSYGYAECSLAQEWYEQLSTGTTERSQRCNTNRLVLDSLLFSRFSGTVLKV